jgi:hypothetical protein
MLMSKNAAYIAYKWRTVRRYRCRNTAMNKGPISRVTLSTVTAVGGLVIGVVGLVFGYWQLQEAQRASQETVRVNDELAQIRANVAEYAVRVDQGSLILVGGGAEFLTPVEVEVKPAWSPVSGVPMDELEGEAVPLRGGRQDEASRSITYSGIVARICREEVHRERCDIAQPSEIRVSVQLPGDQRNTNIVPLM